MRESATNKETKSKPSLVSCFKNTARVFLGAKEDGRIFEKSALIGTSAFLLRVGEWYFIIPAAFAIVSGLRYAGVDPLFIFIFISLLNALFSFLIIFLNDRIGVDLTLMEGAARVLSLLREGESKKKIFLAKMTLSWVIIWCVFYQGPAYVYLLLRENNRVKRHRIFFVISLSFVQMLPWTFIYLAGYQGLLSLFS